MKKEVKKKLKLLDFVISKDIKGEKRIMRETSNGVVSKYDRGFDWSKRCPKCNVRTKIVRKSKYAESTCNNQYSEKPSIYKCKKCILYFKYSPRKRVYFDSGYYGLSATKILGNRMKPPTKRNQDKVPEVPNWDGKSCKECKGRLQYIGGDSAWAPSGATSIKADFCCWKCKLLYKAFEHDD